LSALCQSTTPVCNYLSSPPPCEPSPLFYLPSSSTYTHFYHCYIFAPFCLHFIPHESRRAAIGPDKGYLETLLAAANYYHTDARPEFIAYARQCFENDDTTLNLDLFPNLTPAELQVVCASLH